MREDPKLLPDPEHLIEKGLVILHSQARCRYGILQARLVLESVVAIQKYCILPRYRRLVMVSRPRLNGRDGQRITNYYACAEQIRKS